MNHPTPTEPTGPRETAADIEQAAADWVARLDRGPLSDEEQAELEQWAAADSRHSGAYARAMALNIHLDRVVALGNNFPVAPEPMEAPTRRRVMAVAAGVLVAATTGIGLFTLNRRSASAPAASIATAKGAVRQVALREGSRITLNTGSQVRPDLTPDLRRIDLDEGEALFDVTKDPDRPFIVYAGDLSVRAVGTSFTVRRTGPDAIRVVVTEGVVEVSRKDEVLGRVHAGISFAVEAASTPIITTLNPSQVDSALAWREGRLDLQGMTLSEAAEEFSRYSNLRIRVNDPSIANLHITGVYATSDPEGFARNVALSLGLRSERRGDEVILSKL
jgi:transmembrane sensor